MRLYLLKIVQCGLFLGIHEPAMPVELALLDKVTKIGEGDAMPRSCCPSNRREAPRTSSRPTNRYTGAYSREQLTGLRARTVKRPGAGALLPPTLFRTTMSGFDFGNHTAIGVSTTCNTTTS